MSKIKSKKQFKEQIDAAYETRKPPALVQAPRAAKPTRNQKQSLPTVKSTRPYGAKRESLL